MVISEINGGKDQEDKFCNHEMKLPYGFEAKFKLAKTA